MWRRSREFHATYHIRVKFAARKTHLGSSTISCFRCSQRRSSSMKEDTLSLTMRWIFCSEVARQSFEISTNLLLRTRFFRASNYLQLIYLPVRHLFKASGIFHGLFVRDQKTTDERRYRRIARDSCAFTRLRGQAAKSASACSVYAAVRAAHWHLTFEIEQRTARCGLRLQRNTSG